MHGAKEIEEEFISLIAGIGAFHGLDNLSSRLFAILYLEPEPLCMEDLSQKTGYSLASICNSMKSMEKTGFLEIQKKPKTKKLFFFVNKDLSGNIKAMFERMYEVKIKPAKEKLPAMLASYKKVLKNSGQSRQKFHIMESYYRHVLKSEKIMNLILKELE